MVPQWPVERFAEGNNGVRRMSGVTEQAWDVYKKRRDVIVNYRWIFVYGHGLKVRINMT